MSSLIDARSAWVTIFETIPSVHVYTHGGSFTKAELQRFSREAPGLILSLLRFDAYVQGGIVSAEARWGLIAFTKDGSTADRDRTCVALCEAAAFKILQSFGGENAFGAVSRGRDLVAKNLFSAELDRQTNIAMWGIEFAQTLDLVQEDLSDDWLTAHLTWDLYPRDVAAGDGPPDPPVAPELGEIPEAEDDIDLDP